MARTPKGTIIQPLPSWNIKRMAGGADGIGPVALGEAIAVGLLNNDTQGRWLVVWDLQVYANPAGDINHINTINMGIMAGQAEPVFNTEPTAPLASQTAALPGLIWLSQIVFTPNAALFFANSLPPQGYQWPHDWPICAIGPGDSMVVYSDGNPSDFYGVNFMYEVVSGGL